MIKRIFSFLLGSTLVFISFYNVNILPSAATNTISLGFLSSQAVVCSSECATYPDCTIRMDCSSICIEHSDSFQCGTLVYECSKLCDL